MLANSLLTSSISMRFFLFAFLEGPFFLIWLEFNLSLESITLALFFFFCFLSLFLVDLDNLGLNCPFAIASNSSFGSWNCPTTKREYKLKFEIHLPPRPTGRPGAPIVTLIVAVLFTANNNNTIILPKAGSYWLDNNFFLNTFYPFWLQNRTDAAMAPSFAGVCEILLHRFSGAMFERSAVKQLQ